MRRASSKLVSHLSHYRTLLPLLSRNYISEFSPTIPANDHVSSLSSLSSNNIRPCKRIGGLLLSTAKSDPFHTNPSRNLNTQIETPQQISSRQRKIKERSQLEEALESATTESKPKAFQEVELSIDEKELGAATSLWRRYQLLVAGEDPEKTLAFANRALKALDKNDKPSVLVALDLQLMGSANYSFKRFNDSLGYLNADHDVVDRMFDIGRTLEEGLEKTAMWRRWEAALNLTEWWETKGMMTLEKDSRELGAAYRDLAEAHTAALDFSGALPFCLDALEIHEKQFGHNSVEVAHDRRLLGVVYTGLNRHQKALEQNELLQKVLKNLGHSSELLRAEIDAANMQIALRKYDEAINTLKGVVQRTDKESEDRALIFISMAKALKNQVKFADSKRCLEIACGVLDKREMVSPVEVAEAHKEISRQYETMSEFETGISLLKRTLAMLEKLPQEQHSKGSVSAGIGRLLIWTGKLAQAMPYLESAAERLKEIHDSWRIEMGSFDIGYFGYVLYTYTDLGKVYLELDIPQSAARMFAVVKDIRDGSLGPHHPKSIKACQNLSKAYGAMERYG